MSFMRSSLASTSFSKSIGALSQFSAIGSKLDAGPTVASPAARRRASRGPMVLQRIERLLLVKGVAGIDLAPEELHLGPVLAAAVVLAEARGELRELAGKALQPEDLEQREPRPHVLGTVLDRKLKQLDRTGKRTVLVEEARALTTDAASSSTMVRFWISGKRSSM